MLTIMQPAHRNHTPAHRPTWHHHPAPPPPPPTLADFCTLPWAAAPPIHAPGWITDMSPVTQKCCHSRLHQHDAEEEARGHLPVWHRGPWTRSTLGRRSEGWPDPGVQVHSAWSPSTALGEQTWLNQGSEWLQKQVNWHPSLAHTGPPAVLTG